MTTFSHLALSVADLQRSRAFYCDALGFRPGNEYSSAGPRMAKLMEAPTSGFTGCFLRRGDFFLELLAYADGSRAAEPPRRPEEYGFAHLSFVVGDIGGAVARIERHGGALRTRLDHSFRDAPERPRTVIVFCTDPDGNRIELIEHPDSSERAAHVEFLGLEPVGWPAAGVLEPAE